VSDRAATATVLTNLVNENITVRAIIGCTKDGGIVCLKTERCQTFTICIYYDNRDRKNGMYLPLFFISTKVSREGLLSPGALSRVADGSKSGDTLANFRNERD
jgi:hypothetical protein